MRKFKTRRPRALPFRLLLVVAGGLLLLAALAPKANADCTDCTLIAYWNFEGTPSPGFPVDMTSNAPGAIIGLTLTTNYNVADLSAEPGLPMNVAPGDVEPNLTSLGFHATGAKTPANFDAQLFSAQGIYDVTCVSFAINVAGNGFASVRLGYSFDGGATFTYTAPQAIPNFLTTITFNLAPGTTLNQSLLVIRLQFLGGQSNGANLQDLFDNYQICGTIVPEPATIAGGLLGILGLCFHQRRRLIRSVRLRRA